MRTNIVLSRRHVAGIVLLLLASVTPAAAQPAGDALLREAAAGGHVLLMRHAIAPGTGDPANFRVDDCATQRNLDETGRQQARRFGERLRKAGFTAPLVYASRWCRSSETASLLGFGAPLHAPDALDSFFATRGKAEASTQALRRLIGELPRERTAILVSHQVNVTGLTGIFPASGEAVMLRLEPAGGFAVVGRVRPD